MICVETSIHEGFSYHVICKKIKFTLKPVLLDIFMLDKWNPKSETCN